jgi:hypothetical protein
MIRCWHTRFLHNAHRLRITGTGAAKRPRRAEAVQHAMKAVACSLWRFTPGFITGCWFMLQGCYPEVLVQNKADRSCTGAPERDRLHATRWQVDAQQGFAALRVTYGTCWCVAGCCVDIHAQGHWKRTRRGWQRHRLP